MQMDGAVILLFDTTWHHEYDMTAITALFSSEVLIWDVIQTEPIGRIE